MILILFMSVIEKLESFKSSSKSSELFHLYNSIHRCDRDSKLCGLNRGGGIEQEAVQKGRDGPATVTLAK